METDLLSENMDQGRVQVSCHGHCYILMFFYHHRHLPYYSLSAVLLTIFCLTSRYFSCSCMCNIVHWPSSLLIALIPFVSPSPSFHPCSHSSAPVLFPVASPVPSFQPYSHLSVLFPVVSPVPGFQPYSHLSVLFPVVSPVPSFQPYSHLSVLFPVVSPVPSC